MGWAERCNPKSKWNQARQTRVDARVSTQTTDKQNFQAANPSQKDEPVVIELSLKGIWEILCRRLKLILKRPLQSPAPIS